MNTSCGSDNQPAYLGCAETMFTNVIHAAFVLAGIVTVVIIIFAGVKFITSNGDNKQIDEAKKALTYAIVGLSIVLFSYFIINVISYVTGVGCVKGFTLSGCQ